MVSKVIARVCLFVALYGYGMISQPAENWFNRTTSMTAYTSTAFALLAVIAVSLLVRECRQRD